MNRPAPLLDDLRRTATRQAGRGLDPLIRAAVALATSHVNGSFFDDVLKQRGWADDRTIPMLLRSATSPASFPSGWGAETVATTVALFGAIGPTSAGATLLSRCLQLQFGHTGVIVMPTIKAVDTTVNFVEQGAPIPIVQFAVDSPEPMAPKKFSVITAFTNELFRHSNPNVELLVRDALTASVGLALDKALLDVTAGDAVRPAGLRNAINATAVSIATPPLEAMREDVSTLVAAVSAVSLNAPIILIASPKQATALKLASPAIPFEVLSSSALAASVVMAVASNCVVSATDPVPRLEMAREGTAVMENTAPKALTDGVGPAPAALANVAAPIRSFFQTNSCGVRLIMDVAWRLRDAAGLCWMTGVSW